MSSCAAIDPLVTPFVDGELAPAEARAIEEHIGRCPPCYQRVAAERVTRELLHDRQPSLHVCATPAWLRTRCAAMASRADASLATDRAGRVRSFLGPRVGPLAAAAAVLLVVGGVGLYQATARSSRVLAAELAADHVKCFAMNAVLRTHDTEDIVQAAMAYRFDWRVKLPDSAEAQGMDLVGSRPCLYGEGRIAHIMYRHNGEPVSLFMLPRSDRAPETVEVFGHACAIWSDADRTFVLVSREDPGEVQKLAAFVRASLQ